jgi:hypothetical protein
VSLVDLGSKAVQNGLAGNDAGAQNGAGKHSQRKIGRQHGEVQKRAQQQAGANDDGKTTLTCIRSHSGKNACYSAREIEGGLDRAGTASGEALGHKQDWLPVQEEIEHEHRKEEGKPQQQRGCPVVPIQDPTFRLHVAVRAVHDPARKRRGHEHDHRRYQHQGKHGTQIEERLPVLETY